jgi:hypothetical protein
MRIHFLIVVFKCYCLFLRGLPGSLRLSAFSAARTEEGSLTLV